MLTRIQQKFLPEEKSFEIEDSPKNPWSWKADRPPVENWRWGIQATSTMPLEGIHELCRMSWQGIISPIMAQSEYMFKRFRFVTKFWLKGPKLDELFQGDLDWATHDVLGFLSIVVSMAKEAKYMKQNVDSLQGPKLTVPIMSRLYWTTNYSLVKDKFPTQDLWTIIENIACYENPPQFRIRKSVMPPPPLFLPLFFFLLPLAKGMYTDFTTLSQVRREILRRR